MWKWGLIEGHTCIDKGGSCEVQPQVWLTWGPGLFSHPVQSDE